MSVSFSPGSPGVNEWSLPRSLLPALTLKNCLPFKQKKAIKKELLHTASALPDCVVVCIWQKGHGGSLSDASRRSVANQEWTQHGSIGSCVSLLEP